MNQEYKEVGGDIGGFTDIGVKTLLQLKLPFFLLIDLLMLFVFSHLSHHYLIRHF